MSFDFLSINQQAERAHRCLCFFCACKKLGRLLCYRRSFFTNDSRRKKKNIQKYSKFSEDDEELLGFRKSVEIIKSWRMKNA